MRSKAPASRYRPAVALLAAALLSVAADRSVAAPAPSAVIIFTGDSHTSGTGAPPGNSWPEQLLPMLHRPDVTLVNVARAGAAVAEQIAQWDSAVAPALAATQGTRIVFAMGGYNDITRFNADAKTIIGLYRSEAGLAHAAKAAFVCGIDVLRADRNAGQDNSIVMQVGAVLRAHPAFCDAVVDFQAYPAFARQLGPYPIPPFAADHVHLDAGGQKTMAEIARPAFETLLDNTR